MAGGADAPPADGSVGVEDADHLGVLDAGRAEPHFRVGMPRYCLAGFACDVTSSGMKSPHSMPDLQKHTACDWLAAASGMPRQLRMVQPMKL